VYLRISKGVDGIVLTTADRVLRLRNLLRKADHLDRLVEDSCLVRRVGDVVCLTPLGPGKTQAAALVVRRRGQADARRLVDGATVLRLNLARRKEATARALLARVDATAARRDQDALSVLALVVTAGTVDARLRRVQIRLVKGRVLVPADRA